MTGAQKIGLPLGRYLLTSRWSASFVWRLATKEKLSV
jgi:hypothetical protein